MVPMLVELVGPHAPRGDSRSVERVGKPMPIWIHDFAPNLPDAEIVTREKFLNAGAMLTAANRGDFDLLPVFELIHQAHGDLQAGKAELGVVLSATAIETMVAVLLRVGGPLRGWDTAHCQRALRADFRGQVKHHLASLLGLREINVGQSAWGAWWSGGYELRNALVHEGKLPDRDGAQIVWETTRDLIEWTRTTVNAIPELAPLSRQLQAFEHAPTTEEKRRSDAGSDSRGTT